MLIDYLVELFFLLFLQYISDIFSFFSRELELNYFLTCFYASIGDLDYGSFLSSFALNLFHSGATFDWRCILTSLICFLLGIRDVFMEVALVLGLFSIDEGDFVVTVLLG